MNNGIISKTIETMIKKILVLALIITCAKSVHAYDFEAGGLYYNIISTADMTCKVVSCDEDYSGDLKIPATVTFKNRELNVIEIGKSAFIHHKLTSVIIPNSVTSIGDNEFRDCRSLASVEITNSVTSNC